MFRNFFLNAGHLCRTGETEINSLSISLGVGMPPLLGNWRVCVCVCVCVYMEALSQSGQGLRLA